jgi:hypothetical protein
VANLAAAVVSARIAAITLKELVSLSDLVLYGETAEHHDRPSDTDAPVIWFKVTALSKKPPRLVSGDVPICDQTTFRDTIDLRKYPGAYVVFAKWNGQCFAPIAGYKSLIPVSQGVARTGDIDGQPQTEPLNSFLDKIGKLIANPRTGIETNR